MEEYGLQPIPKIRKTVTRKLCTGQKIILTVQEEKLLKNVFDFMAEFSQKKIIGAHIESKKVEISNLSNKMSAAARVFLFNNKNPNGNYDDTRSRTSGSNFENDDLASSESISNTNLINTIIETDSSIVDPEAKVEHYYTLKDELTALEESLKRLTDSQQRITYKDIDGLLKWLGTTMSKKQIEQMIWEVDEMNDGCVCYDEFCLTYYRNVNSAQDSKDHPSAFFHLLDFLLFDQSGAYPKGYFMEDDCMEILYARHGGQNLEKEMKLLFGDKLKASGGDGTLRFHEYMSSRNQRIGRRALVA